MRSRHGMPTRVAYDAVLQFAQTRGALTVSFSGAPCAGPAVEEGIITLEQRFTLHGLKHRGVADTPGSRRRKQIASGHETEAMVQLCDHEVPLVAPASPEAFVPPKPWQE